jgi:hypothetical protein
MGMKYLKSFKFWIAFFIVFYTVLGFIFIPWFLTNKTAPILKDKIGLHVEIGKAKFNPYTFKLEINDILLKDLNKKPVISFKKIFINYIPLGLIQNTLLFSELKIVSPKIYASIEKDGKLNFENILPPSKKEVPKEKETASTNLPIITLQKLTITDGNIKFTDTRGKKEFNLNFGPYNFNAHDISTEKDALNAHRFITKINKDGKLFWEGGVRLNPLKLYGEIKIKNLKLPKFYIYAFSDFDATLKKGKMDLNIPYKVDLSNNLKFSIDSATAMFSDIAFTNKKNSSSLLGLKKLNIAGLNFNWPQKSIEVTKIELDKPYVSTTLGKNKELTLLKAFSSKAKKEYKEVEEDKPNEWSLLLKDIFINSGNLTFIDAMQNKPIQSNISKLSLHLKDITLNQKQPINYLLSATLNKNALLKSNGNIFIKPFKLKSSIEVKEFDTTNYVNYVKPYINFLIEGAKVSSQAKIDVSYKDELKLNILGDVAINNLLVKTNDMKKLLAWKSLNINGISYIHNPMKLNIHDLILDEPYIRAHVSKKGITNFSGLIKESKNKVEKNENKNTKKENSLKIKIGPMKLVNGTSDFSDFSLPFPFQTHIHDLNGEFSTLDFQSTTPSLLSLKGKIDKYGYTDIEGKLSPFDIKKNANLALLFKNIDLNSMTPYSGKFIGYKIKSGKLSMDLKYSINQAKLIGDNKINIDTLTLGEKVDSPDAPSLPLELAIALLKDSNGQIDIDMPVSGDLNNPEFSYGGVIWRAVGNMITGIVTAPFRFLGSMLGVDGDDLKAIDFDKGSTKVIITENEKLDNLGKILSKRPAIKLSITGGYDEVFDKYELQKQKFKTIINKKLREKKKDAQNDIYGSALKDIYVKNFSIKQYDKLKSDFIIKEDDNKTKKTVKKPKEKIDVISFNNKMQKEITTNIKVDNKELEKLANQRANSIKIELIKKYKIDKKRLNILVPKTVKAKRDRWIESELEITI